MTSEAQKPADAAALEKREIKRMDAMLNGTVLSGHSSGIWHPGAESEDALVDLPDGDYRRKGSTWTFTVKHGRVSLAWRDDMAA